MTVNQIKYVISIHSRCNMNNLILITIFVVRLLFKQKSFQTNYYEGLRNIKLSFKMNENCNSKRNNSSYKVITH